MATNVLSLASGAFHDLLFGALSSLPVEGLIKDSPSSREKKLRKDNERLRKENRRIERRRIANAKRSRQISQRVAGRTARNLAFNVASIPGEAVPVAGAALILAVTAADVHAGCETVKDVKELAHLAGADGTDIDTTEVCGIELPSLDAVRRSFADRYFGG